MKKTKRNAIILSVVILFLIIGAISYFKPVPQRQVDFTSQCSLQTCPSGYDEVDTYCDDNTRKCTRECEKEIDGYCGSYGSFSIVKSMSILSPVRGNTYSTSSYSMRSDKCYKFYAKALFSVSSWGTADSYKLTAEDDLGGQTIKCSTSSNSNAETTIYTRGRGSTALSNYASAKYYDYGSSSCSGGDPISKLKGSLNIYLYAATAPWNSPTTDTKKYTCTYQCNQNSDCGTNAYVGSKYCKNDNVYQMYRTYSCSNSQCSFNEAETLVTSCSNGCANGACMLVDCNNGDEKCVGSEYFTCSANKWVSQGEVIGKCGANCVEKDIIFQGNDYYICYGGTYKKITDVLELPLEQQEQMLDLINQLNASTQEKARIIEELTTTLEGQIKIINSLTTSIEEKSQIISQLELNLNDQINLIDELENSIEEKAVIIANLNINIQEQSIIIESLTNKVEEQAIIINSLNLNVEDQAQMINALTQNLNDKSYLVSQLQSENQQQAELISQMQESFTNQAIIIDGLNKEIEDDAEIISNLHLSLNDQAALINELRLNNQEKAELIQNLNLQIDEQAELIQSLNLKLADEAEIIKNLELTTKEQGQLINKLQLTVEQQAELIASLQLSVQNEKILVEELQSTIEQQNDLIAKINAEKNKLIMKSFIKAAIYFTIIIGILVFMYTLYRITRKRKNKSTGRRK